jgi:hypothetical protein
VVVKLRLSPDTLTQAQPVHRGPGLRFLIQGQKLMRVVQRVTFKNLSESPATVWDTLLSVIRPDAIYIIQEKTRNIEVQAEQYFNADPADPLFVEGWLCLKSFRSVKKIAGVSFSKNQGLYILALLQRIDLASCSLDLFCLAPYEDLLHLFGTLVNEIEHLSAGTKEDSGIILKGLPFKLPQPTSNLPTSTTLDPSQYPFLNPDERDRLEKLLWAYQQKWLQGIEFEESATALGREGSVFRRWRRNIKKKFEQYGEDTSILDFDE